MGGTRGRGSRKKKQKHFSYFDAAASCFGITETSYGDRATCTFDVRRTV